MQLRFLLAPILCIAPVLSGAIITIDENARFTGVVLATNAKKPGVPIPVGDQPVLGYVIFCEGAVAAGGRACAEGTPTLPGATVSDIFQWDVRIVDATVLTPRHTEYFVKVFSDVSDGKEPLEPNLADLHFACPPNVPCLVITEPGLTNDGGVFRETGPEIFRYNVTAGMPGWVPNDPDRIYILISDAPEPGSLAMIGAGLLAMFAGLRRRRN